MNSDQQDEADIKLILAYAADATACGAISIDNYLLTEHGCVSLGYLLLPSIVQKRTLSRKQERVTKH